MIKYYNRVRDHVGPFEVVSTDDPRDPVGLRDRSGRWIITPDQGYNSFSHYDDGLMIAHLSTDLVFGWFLIDYHGNRVSERYGFIEPAGEGYYMVEKGSRRNIMRRDGTLVLSEWPHRVGKVRDGFFSIGNTIRKTATTPTKHIEGVAHISGVIVFPMVFESLGFYDDSDGSDMWAQKDGLPYHIHNGALFDPQKKHYPSEINPDNLAKFFENTANWILPGLQFFYRDTDAPIDAEAMYPVGKVFRTGFYTTVSTRLQKPIQKTRFLIASAHAAIICSDGETAPSGAVVSLSPHAEEWRQAVLHKNAWLKVLDIYKSGGVTQVFMLQIPETAAVYLGDDDTVFNFVNKATGNDTTLVELARRSLDDKLCQPVHPRSLDSGLISLMAQPICYDENRQPYSIAPDLTFDENFSGWGPHTEKKEQYFSRILHNLANDRDIIRDIDGFPWRGIVGSVCEGCMYAKGTHNRPFGCGRLFTKSFRKSYINGSCDYWKISLEKESDFEERKRWNREKEAEHSLKVSGSYAASLVNDFVNERLDGSIDCLASFDLWTLKEDGKYGPIKGPGSVPHYAIVKSIMEIAFGEYWPGLNVETLDKYQYLNGLIVGRECLTGIRYQENEYSLIKQHCPDDKYGKMAEDLFRIGTTIGNVVVWPNKANLATLYDGYKMRGYIDRMLVAIYNVMTGAGRQDMSVKEALYKNRKMMSAYQGKEGFTALMRNMLLDGFLDSDGGARLIFDGVSCSARDFKPELLPAALTQYHDFMVPLIQRRSVAIIARLKQKLGL